MIMKIKKLLTLFAILMICGVAFSQGSCKNYHIKKCGGYGPPFKYSGQSKSAMFEVGETSSFKMNTFGGFEYSVNICAEKQLKGIYFRIKESARSVLYDSQTDKVLDKQFYIEDSKVLIIEVVVPEGKKPKEELDYKDLTGCVGVIIEYRKVGKKGFDK